MTCSSFWYFVTFTSCEKESTSVSVNLDKKRNDGFLIHFNLLVGKHIKIFLYCLLRKRGERGEGRKMEERSFGILYVGD